MQADLEDGDARYVFKIQFRLNPASATLSADPDTFETTLFRWADQPGEDDWLFFRDNCWRGNLADEAYFRGLAVDALGVPVESATFRELQTTPAYLEDLKTTIATDLGLFNADSVTEVLSKYLGSSIRVVQTD